MPNLFSHLDTTHYDLSRNLGGSGTAVMEVSNKQLFPQLDIETGYVTDANSHKIKIKEEDPVPTFDDSRSKSFNSKISDKPAETNKLFGDTVSRPTDSIDSFLDKDWAKQAFLIDDLDLDGFDSTNRYYSTADRKFTDTRLGGNIGINPRPQFTRYSDIRCKGRLAGRNDVSIQNTGGNHGMGRYYSEAIDDNAQTIFLRFGVPQFNSLAGFFSRAFDPNLSSLARTGKTKSAWYTLGNVVGTIAVVTAFPVLSGTIIAGRLISTFFTRATSKFYTLKPTMHLYWSAVNMLVNSIAINKGIMPRMMDTVGLNNPSPGQKIGNPYKLDAEFLDKLHKLMPSLFRDNRGIDVFAIATQAQRLANQAEHAEWEAFDRASATNYTGIVDKSYQRIISNPTGAHSFGAWVNEVLKFGDYYINETEGSTHTEMSPKVDPNDTNTVISPTDSAEEKSKKQAAQDAENQRLSAKGETFKQFFDAEFRQGSQFAAFKVDHTGAISEAFANSATESDLSQKYNGISSQAREAKFSLAGGNITGTAVEDFAKGAIGAAADVVAGALNGVTFNIFQGLSGLAGSGFIDIPKHWQSSSVSLPRSSYTMQLISPYGNVFSQIQNIIIPLAMIMAAAMPRSTGSQSYTSPFICQLWDRGRAQVQLGMIDSLSIQRGTCNLPFTNKGVVQAIDVTFSVTDLSSIMHMPMSTGALFGGNTAIDEDNILMDYLAVLAGQDLYSQIYTLPKAKLKLAKTLNEWSKVTSPAWAASLVHESTTTGALSFLGDTFEALLPGAAILRGTEE